MTEIQAASPANRLTRAQKQPCADCPFRKDSRRETLTCQNMLSTLDGWESGSQSQHTCHKTHPPAFGYKNGYTGEILVCAGALAMAQKSGINFDMKTDPENEKLVWSGEELKTVYKPVIRRNDRWERKKGLIMKRKGLKFDAQDSYITDGAIYASIDDKQSFFTGLKKCGF